MGLNISVRKLGERTMEETWGGQMVEYIEVEDQPWFDNLRYAGDTDFVLQNNFMVLDNEGLYKRPKDFDSCRIWVNKNIVEANRNRLLIALTKLEQDESLAFRWSW